MTIAAPSLHHFRIMHRIVRSTSTRSSLALLLCASLLGAVAPATDADARARSHTDAHVRSRVQPLAVARIFGDGVVLQRGTRVPVWGTGTAGARIGVSFRGRTTRATADGAGRWRVELAPMAAGGPFTMLVRSERDSLMIRDVLVGDVWVASGQSNMEWPLSMATGGLRDAATGRDERLREFKVPNSWSWTESDELAGGSWAAADSAHAGRFSAVAYYFARELRAKTGVPIGILNSSWSGSSISPWMSRRALSLDDASWQAIRAGEDRYRAGVRDALRVRLGGNLPTVDSGMTDGRAIWAAPSFDDAAWRTMAVPGPWEKQGLAGLDGIAWYRTTFTLSDADVQRGVRVVLGAIDDADMTWVNGVQVGQTNGYATVRDYAASAAALRAGTNVLTVRVVDGGGDGGIMGGREGVYLEVGGERRALSAEWRFTVATVTVGEDGQHTNKIPAALYNRMVHPLLDFPIKGVIWYQGESNANNDEQAKAYRQEFAGLIQSWRGEWRASETDFPFLWVQLPNYGAPEATPPASGSWAHVRESQTAALSLPNTGQAITIDVGDAADLHPRNKADVGHRLALLAESIAYRMPVVANGPTYRGHTVVGNRIDVRFAGVGAGLLSRDSSTQAATARVGGFAIAGADGKFVWADARIAGNIVRVSSTDVSRPVSVRYAWGNSPSRATLYNRNGLPAAPFRTDADRSRWTGTWEAAPQLVEERNLPPAPGLTGSTLRQVIHVSIGGSRVRLRFANLFGNGPIRLDAVQVAASAGGSAIAPGSSKALTFRGGTAVTLNPGTTVVSDPIDFPVRALADLTVTTYIASAPTDVTGHPGSRTTSYLQTGDHTSAVSMPEAVKTEHWYVLSGLDVTAGDSAAAIAVIGNSITDGRGSGTDQNNRWPDELSRRLQANSGTRAVAVLNAGLGGNAVVRGGLGPPASWRFTRDVLEQHGVRWAVVFEGVNDIGGARGADASAAVARDLIAAYTRFIVDAHARGIRIYGATIMPFGGSQYDSPEHEAARQTVNAWIRTSGEYDAIIDFDAALRDPANPARLLPATDTGDHLHPNEAGHRLMATAVDLALFRTPSPRQ